MTTIVIDAELVTGDASFVVGAGTYTVDDLPTKSELDGEFFTFPAGLVVAGGKEVWDYDTVVPIDDYAALGPRETPPDTLATPWPEDEMVSADMHFNLGMHVQQLAVIAEDHEKRLRELETKVELIFQILSSLGDLLGSQLPTLASTAAPDPGHGRHVTQPNTHIDFGYNPNSTALGRICSGIDNDGRFDALVSTGTNADVELGLNTVVSMQVTVTSSVENLTPSGRTYVTGTYVDFSVRSDASSVGAHSTANIVKRSTWISEEPNGRPVSGTSVTSGKYPAVQLLIYDTPADLAVMNAAGVSGTPLPSGKKYYWNTLFNGYGSCNRYGVNMMSTFIGREPDSVVIGQYNNVPWKWGSSGSTGRPCP